MIPPAFDVILENEQVGCGLECDQLYIDVCFWYVSRYYGRERKCYKLREPVKYCFLDLVHSPSFSGHLY